MGKSIFEDIKNIDLQRRPLRTYQRQRQKTPDFVTIKEKRSEIKTPLSVPLKRYYGENFEVDDPRKILSSPIKSTTLIEKTRVYEFKFGKKKDNYKRRKLFETKSKFTQLCLDLLPSRITCSECGMSYTRGSAADETIHSKFHAKSIKGIDYPITNSIKEVWKENFTSNKIIMITMSSPLSEIKKAKKVLSVVDLELGSASPFPSSMNEHNHLVKQYKFFLYLKGKKCIGLILVEPIQSAYPVYPSSSQSSSITLEPEALSTYIMGVSRIWVCKTYRREKIATLLLDIACNHFIYGITVKKHEVAFSQPSESGKLFIENWTGKKFSVYIEN
ncbi:hypothetical protein PNEG_03217 [Pneumocystis murina B123]|uniref:N-acetyltransferase ECO1 n=1 Tax=Pneumocystis murina (strain B123) TaxID=1069680 RepID=M7NMD6_PNEMU|nr:hypothetical protein PNEG_03217 [Pneumocystis murina B123]EMR08377.1 hypothetical protein PNEG_03217 [Pneumocystis murina B123]